jgi:transcriptional regulator with AAA-type ATPase domain
VSRQQHLFIGGRAVYVAEISELSAVLQLPLLSLLDTRELTHLSLDMQRSTHLFSRLDSADLVPFHLLLHVAVHD